ncbi:class I SAM-dependent methyltransferase [Chromobacterium sphagni]|uniref:SAM-dependent methyltransferase n=1 Tax=Chromobacterium sphagni TaxID=1903179 RepID=A0ABX3CC75_9NEIS|nr:class I SAM-dependent methyltransferase [Chromobacterium sphagni]OHX19607.1 SAM-dependent methyltransferase [Chromobacterium sphagni]
MREAGHAERVQQQFGEQAAAYLSSVVHAQGEEFAQLRDAVAAQAGAKVLDLGCGAGHVSFQVAERAGQVVAYDLSALMLQVVADEAARRGLLNVNTRQGAAERLPFADAEFDFVFSRYSAHHWSDVPLALREVRRVLKPGGRAAFIDIASPGAPLLDTHLQAVEVLRDTSHVRNYSHAEWHAMLAAASLHAERSQRLRLRLEFSSWVERMRTPQLMQQAIRVLQQSMGREVRDYFDIGDDGSFSSDVLVLWATA